MLIVASQVVVQPADKLIVCGLLRIQGLIIVQRQDGAPPHPVWQRNEFVDEVHRQRMLAVF